MTIPHPRELKQDADRALALAPEAKRLILIFSGAAAAVSLLASFVTFLLDSGIAGTGGLSGMGLRSILTSMQTMLSLGVLLAMPFWTMGYVAAVLKLGRRENAETKLLFSGFRRFGPVLRMLLLEVAVCFLLGVLCVNVGTTVLSFTPLIKPYMELAMTLDQSMLLQPDEATMLAMMDALQPVIIACSVLYLGALAVLSYFLRMARYILMDEPKVGAVRAMLGSVAMMKGNCRKLFRLDLSWWWYYALDLLVGAVCLGDLWLPRLGITFPFSEDVAYFIFYILGLGLQLALHVSCSNRVEVSYSLAYDSLKDRQIAK